jgi:signal transduction histidine kinase
VNPLRSVRGKLGLALVVIVAGALGIVYFVVVPSYESSLTDTRLDRMEKNLRNIVSDAPPIYLSQEWVQQEAQPLAEARVVVLHRPVRNGPIVAISDSSPPHGTSLDVRDDPIATKALERYPQCRSDGEWRCLERGTVTRDGEVHAEVSYPLTEFVVVLLTAPLTAELDTVANLRQRMLLAGALATVFALVLGWALATLFARRIRRLDTAAARIADGGFDTPVVDTDPDELGQLARTFDRMRIRLASLERARAEFIANASHELRTPLFSLAGFLELLASEELDADTRADFMTAIRGQVTRLTKLATDLLDLSKLDAGKLAVATETVDLAQVGEVLATDFGPRVVTSGHTLELDMPVPVLAVADEARVLQIGRILVENAIVHTPAGTRIRVTAGSLGDTSVLAVEDDGPGIEHEAQSHIFDRFYRLDRSVASGSGLGLAIASELAALMGGRVELRSAPAATRFMLLLPADVADRAQPPARAPLLAR